MSNVLVSIASRPPCLSTAARRIPFLQLFSSLQFRDAPFRKASSSCLGILEQANSSQRSWQGTRQLSTSVRLGASKRAPSVSTSTSTTKQNPNILPSSRLQPTDQEASHTEGVLDTETWRDYDAEGGLPLPNGELSQRDIHTVFRGENVGVDTGNYILSVLHWRRMSGALIDTGIDFPRASGVNERQAMMGLEYLRTTFPAVDEEELGVQWAEEQTKKMQIELQQRAVDLGLYKPIETVEEVEKEDETLQGTAYGRARSGRSALEGLQQAFKERDVEREAKRTIAQAEKERKLLHATRGPLELGGGIQRSVGVVRYATGDVVIKNPDPTAWLALVERKPWVKHYEQQAMIIKENKVPQLSLFRRLVPSVLVVLATIGLCVYLSNNYTPPPTSARMFPDVPPSVATMGGITAIMLTTFVLGRIPPLWRLSSKYFCLVPAYPYAASLIGAMFRHDTFVHLTTNMITLWLFGIALHENVGRGTFLAIFLGSGALGGVTSLAYNVLAKRWTTYIFGASGAVSGVIGALCTLHPQGKINVFGYEIPVAAWLFLALSGGWELYGVFRPTSKIDHLGHLGGLAAGTVAALYLRAKVSREKGPPDAVRREGDLLMKPLEAT